jgi:hypothetical protein
MKMRFLFVVVLWTACVAGCCSNNCPNTRISLCYDPDLIAREDDLQELRIVDVFDGGHPFVDEIVSCLKRDDFPPRSYTFCGILCYVVCEVNGVPACVAEILQDGKTVYISVPFGSEPGMVYKKDGSYFVKDDLTPIAHPCYSIPELVEKVSCLVSDSFKEQERSGCHKVELFKPSDR